MRERSPAAISILTAAPRRNVFALEAVLKSHPNGGRSSHVILYRLVDLPNPLLGIFLTFIQFLYVTLETLSTQFTFSPPEGKSKQGGRYWLPRLKPRVVPLRRWIVQVALFLAVSLMNNWAFGLKVPVPIHIIFRSGGEFQGEEKGITPELTHQLDRTLCFHVHGLDGRRKAV